MDYEIKHKEDEGHGMFFIEDEQGMASEMTYTKRENNIMAINHTETRGDLRGKNLASLILAHVVNYARDNNFKIDPLCSFVAAKFKHNQEYQELKA